MRCSTCFSSEGKLQMFQGDIDNDTFKRIKFVLPNLSIPESQDPVFICTTCLEQVSFFYTIKKASLRNCSRLKYFNATLKGTNNIKCKEVLVKINSDEVAPQPIEHIEIKVDPDSIYLLSSEEQEKHIKKEDKIYNNSDTASLDYLQEEGSSSCNTNNSTQKYNNSYLDKFAKKDSNLTSNDSFYKDQPETQPESQKERFKCTYCPKTYTRLRKLKAHTRVHTGERPYKCATCQKTFSLHHQLNVHKLTHTDEKPFECDVCHKAFNYKSNFLTHKRFHDNVRPFPCTVCSKAFITSDHLATHMRGHTGEKPHQCHLCEYKCTQAGNLKVHIRSHTGERPYSCNHCDKSFKTTSDLKKHKHRRHSNDDSD